MKRISIIYLVAILVISIIFDNGKGNEVDQDNGDISLVAEEGVPIAASDGSDDDNSPIEEEAEEIEIDNPCEVCGECGYSYKNLDGSIHYYCIDHYLEALDEEEAPDDIIVTDLPEEHCAYPECDNDGEFYFEPSNIWLCDMHFGDYNDIDEFD